MKIGISLAPQHLGKEKYKALKSAGFDCLDFNLADTDALPYTLCDEEFNTYLDEERMASEGEGITIHQVHGPWCWPIREVTPDGMKERLASMKRCVFATARLGAEYMVIHPIMPNGIKDRSNKFKSADTVEKNVLFMTELAYYAKTLGVTVCLENMPFPAFSISTPEEVADIVYKVNSDSFKMCLDTGHAVIFEGWQPSVAIERYPDIIKTLHVHDNRGTNDEHLLPLGGGIIDWKAFSSALDKIGFNGVLSLECAPGKNLPNDIYTAFLGSYAKLCKYLTEMHLV